MTAETLKPFIPPTTDNFPATHSPTTRRQRNNNYLALGLSLVALVLAIAIIGVTTWNSMRIGELQTEVKSLNKVIENMQKRLGIDYLEDISEFEKGYQNALIDDVDSDDDDEEDVDDDDLDDPDDDDEDILTDSYEDIAYTDLLKKYKSYDDDLAEEDTDNASNVSEDDNVYDDFGKYKDSKKRKQTRKTRSISHTENEIKLLGNDDTKGSANIEHFRHKLNYDSIGFKGSHKRHIVSEDPKSHRSPLRPRSTRKRKYPMLKSGESSLSAKSLALTGPVMDKPAAHFHLNRKVPERQGAIRLDSYRGDMYIGHPSWANEMDIDRFFKIDQGVLVVRQPGLYYVYAQVCYNNTHDQNGFVIFHGHKPFLQCLNTVPTNLPLKIHTCHTSGLIHLQPNDTIHLRDFHADRNAILRDTNNRSYFGLIKV